MSHHLKTIFITVIVLVFSSWAFIYQQDEAPAPLIQKKQLVRNKKPPEIIKQSDQENLNYQTYENSEFGFSFLYPKTWESPSVTTKLIQTGGFELGKPELTVILKSSPIDKDYPYLRVGIYTPLDYDVVLKNLKLYENLVDYSTAVHPNINTKVIEFSELGECENHSAVIFGANQTALVSADCDVGFDSIFPKLVNSFKFTK